MASPNAQPTLDSAVIQQVLQHITSTGYQVVAITTEPIHIPANSSSQPNTFYHVHRFEAVRSSIAESNAEQSPPGSPNSPVHKRRRISRNSLGSEEAGTRGSASRRSGGGCGGRKYNDEAEASDSDSQAESGDGSDGEGSDGEGSDGEGSDGEGSDGDGGDDAAKRKLHYWGWKEEAAVLSWPRNIDRHTLANLHAAWLRQHSPHIQRKGRSVRVHLALLLDNGITADFLQQERKSWSTIQRLRREAARAAGAMNGPHSGLLASTAQQSHSTITGPHTASGPAFAHQNIATAASNAPQTSTNVGKGKQPASIAATAPESDPPTRRMTRSSSSKKNAHANKPTSGKHRRSAKIIYDSEDEAEGSDSGTDDSSSPDGDDSDGHGEDDDGGDGAAGSTAKKAGDHMQAGIEAGRVQAHQRAATVAPRASNSGGSAVIADEHGQPRIPQYRFTWREEVALLHMPAGTGMDDTAELHKSWLLENAPWIVRNRHAAYRHRVELIRWGASIEVLERLRMPWLDIMRNEDGFE